MRFIRFSRAFISSSQAAVKPSISGEASTSTAANQVPKSILPKGSVMTGLNFYKTGKDPVALDDHEYPEWLYKLSYADQMPLDQLPPKVRIRKLRGEHIKKVNASRKKK